MKTSEISKSLKERVYKKFLEREDWDKRSLLRMIEDEFKVYNEEALNILLSMVTPYINELPALVPTETHLSGMLYKNGRKASLKTAVLLYEMQQARYTIKKIARKLFDGYGYDDDEVLSIRKTLPRYIEKHMKKPSLRALRQIDKLKTIDTKIAYKRLVEVLETGNSSLIRRALKTALEERARQYADRIAYTEEARMFNLQKSKKLLEDDGVEFVKFRTCTCKREKDICDYYGLKDSGHGKGIYRKDQMVTLPLHPFCHCTYDAYYRKVKKRKAKDPLAKLRVDQKISILGSHENYERYLKGEDPIDIINSNRSKQFKIRPVKQDLQL